MPSSTRIAASLGCATLFAALAGLVVACTTTVASGGPSGEVDAGDARGPLGLRAFITATAFDGNLVTAAGGKMGGQAAGDGLCQTAARGAGLSGTWVAYLATGVDSANDHVVDDGPFYAVDGKTELYANKAAVGGGARQKIPDEHGEGVVDIVGGQATAASFWTGATAAGVPSGKNCKGWTAAGLFDDGSSATYMGLSTFVPPCQSKGHLLCLEQRQLRAGRPDKRVFVTRKGFQGDFASGATSALAGADARCAEAASDAALNGTFRAWLSADDGGRTVRASERVSDARYSLLDGRVAFESRAQLASGPSVVINVTEVGETLADVRGTAVWTGTLTNGTPSPDARCANWSSASRTQSGVVGELALEGRWTNTRVDDCATSNHLYCFEE